MLDGKYDNHVFDIEYLRHRDEAYLVWGYRLRGQGPFSAMIDAHGGARIADDGIVNEANDRVGAAAK